MPLVVYIWVFGVIAMAVYALISYAAVRRKIRASIKGNDNIYVCDEIKSPFILGIIRPRIYIPSGITGEVRENVIAHEKAHIKRHDFIWKPLGFALLSVYWINPIMWAAYIFLCRDIEAACDEKVISQMDRAHIAGYSQALLVCASQRRMITACPIAFGETDVKGRIRNVLSYKKPAFWIICISVLICIVVAVCFLTNPKKDKGNGEVVFGTYAKNDSMENPMFSWSGLTINEDGTFTFSPSVISSYMGAGTWTIEGDYVTFNDIGMGDNRKEVFRYGDGKLYYEADKSASDSMWGLDDGAEYVLQTEDSFKEIMEDNSGAETVDESNTDTGKVDESVSDAAKTDKNGSAIETVDKGDKDKSSEYVGTETELFKEMSGEYWMLSGTGGWETRIYLYSDGYFVGLYEDSDAGSVERCAFSGYFEYPVDLSETGYYEYPADLSENAYVTHIGGLVYEEPGKISEEDGIRVTTATPYGFDGASTTYIYAPGYPVSLISNNEYYWLSAEREEFWDKKYEKAKDDVLPCFAIRNIDHKSLAEVDYMFTKVPERYRSDLGLKRIAGNTVSKNDSQEKSIGTITDTEKELSWDEITADGVDEELLFDNIDVEILNTIGKELQTLVEEENEAERANPEIVITEGWTRVFKSERYKRVLALGQAAMKPLYLIVYKSENAGAYEYICARALYELAGCDFDWVNSKDFLEKFNEKIIREKK